MLARTAEPGRNEHGAELVTVQGDGVTLIIQPRPPDMRGRGVLEKFFLHGVFVEPGDGAQPPGDGGAGAPVGFQVAGEVFDVGAADGEQVQGAGAAPGGELAQVQRVGLAGQAAIPGQREPFGIGERWLDGTRAAVVVVIGYLPVGLRPVRLGQPRPRQR